MAPQRTRRFACEFRGPAHLSAGICHGPAGQSLQPPAEPSEWPSGLGERPATAINYASYVEMNYATTAPNTGQAQ
jgi:hypothetical protein